VSGRPSRARLGVNFHFGCSSLELLHSLTPSTWCAGASTSSVRLDQELKVVRRPKWLALRALTVVDHVSAHIEQ
jgi:hypothetical protein